MDCIFCKIAAGEVPSDVVYRDEQLVAFRDINPQAPVHILVVPVAHVTYLSEFTDEQASLLGRMVLVANQLARREGIAEKGYRVVINCGQQGGQLVPHVHLHLLGGRSLSGQLG